MGTADKYELLERIGTGGMAEIWKGRVRGPSGFEKVVAIKRILPHLLDDERLIAMLIGEAKLVAGLQHPNIVQVFAFEVTGDGEHFITMEYVSGCNLLELLQTHGPLDERLAAYVGLQICAALGYAHDYKDADGKPCHLVHRDVSPQNVLLSEQGVVKITDFGIAKIATQLEQTQAGMVKGKLTYMSPEQARGDVLDLRTDLFSLGVLLAFALTGKRMWTSSGAALLQEIAEYAGPGLEDLSDVPIAFRPIVDKLLQRDPADRYASAWEVEAALSEKITPAQQLEARARLAAKVRRRGPTVSSMIEEPGQDDETIGTGPSQPTLEYQSDPVVPAIVTPQELPEPREDQPTGPSRSPEISELMELPPESEFPKVREKPRPPALTPARVRALVGVLGFALVALALWLGHPWTYLAQWQAARATPAPVSPTGVPTTAKPTPKKAASRTPVPAATGRVSIHGKPWVEVWIDGNRIAGRTPIRGLVVARGKHTLGFRNDAAGFKRVVEIEVVAADELEIYVDATTGKVTFK